MGDRGAVPSAVTSVEAAASAACGLPPSRGTHRSGCLVLSALLLAMATEVYGLGGTDTAGCYSFSDTIAPLDANAPTYSFTDIAGTGTQIVLSDDQVSAPIPLGFTFNYYGVGYSDVRVSSNGFLTFLPGQSSGCCTGEPIPDAFNPNGIIAGWWEDLFPGVAAGTVNFQIVGSTPQRVFIVQFGSVSHFGSSNPVTFQFKLFEADDGIEVHYASIPADFGTHSAGIEDENGTIGAQWKRGSGLAFTDTAVRYSATPATTVSGRAPTPTGRRCDVRRLRDNCPATPIPARRTPGRPTASATSATPCVGLRRRRRCGDGVCDGNDNCPGISNPGQEDADSDGFGDVCDFCVGFGGADSDGDGLCDPGDNCPTDANPGQEDADFDGIGDACDPCAADTRHSTSTAMGSAALQSSARPAATTAGSRSIPARTTPTATARGDACDNCPADANPGQEDADFDDIGDACDPCAADPTPFDFDGDGFCSSPTQCPAGCDNCPFTHQPRTGGSGRGCRRERM